MRYGRTETKFRGTFDADTVHYKAKAPYASWRLQAGWRYPLSETINTDLYARYGLNDFGGDSVALHNRTNDTLVAHASTTSTARIGALIPFANSVWSGAVGAAYELPLVLKEGHRLSLSGVLTTSTPCEARGIQAFSRPKLDIVQNAPRTGHLTFTSMVLWVIAEGAQERSPPRTRSRSGNEINSQFKQVLYFSGAPDRRTRRPMSVR